MPLNYTLHVHLEGDGTRACPNTGTSAVRLEGDGTRACPNTGTSAVRLKGDGTRAGPTPLGGRPPNDSLGL